MTYRPNYLTTTVLVTKDQWAEAAKRFDEAGLKWNGGASLAHIYILYAQGGY